MSLNDSKPMDVFGPAWKGYMDKIKADWDKKVGAGDLVLIAGDISWAMRLDDALSDISSISRLKGEKIMIRGNHDYWWKSLSQIRSRLPEGFYAVQNDAIRFDGVVICGSRGWKVEGSPDFTEDDRKLYLREAERLNLALKAADKIKKEGDKLIVMVHFPPFNVKLENSIYTELFEKHSVNAVVYGHLHGKESRTVKKLNKNGVVYYLTSCDKVDFSLTEIEI